MKNISLENAIKISKAHQISDSIEFSFENVKNSSLSATESCAVLLIKYANSAHSYFPTTKLGEAYVSSNSAQPKYHQSVICGKERFSFSLISQTVLDALGCNPNDCHQNCINICSNFNKGVLHTAEISVVSKENSSLSGILHSFLEIEDEVFDFTYGFKMPKPEYFRLLNVNDLTQTPASKVHADICDGTLSQISDKNISPEVYLMARNDCARLVGNNK